MSNSKSYRSASTFSRAPSLRLTIVSPETCEMIRKKLLEFEQLKLFWKSLLSISASRCGGRLNLVWFSPTRRLTLYKGPFPSPLLSPSWLFDQLTFFPSSSASSSSLLCSHRLHPPPPDSLRAASLMTAVPAVPRSDRPSHPAPLLTSHSSAASIQLARLWPGSVADPGAEPYDERDSNPRRRLFRVLLDQRLLCLSLPLSPCVGPGTDSDVLSHWSCRDLRPTQG